MKTLLVWDELRPFVVAIQNGNVEELLQAAESDGGAAKELGLWPALKLIQEADFWSGEALEKLRLYRGKAEIINEVGHAERYLADLTAFAQQWPGIGLNRVVEQLATRCVRVRAWAHAEGATHQKPSPRAWRIAL